MSPLVFNRRTVVGGIAAGIFLPAIITAARAAQPIDAVGDFGLDSNDSTDQTSKLQAALNAAAADGRLLIVPGGGFSVGDLEIPNGVHVIGTPGQTIFTAASGRFGHVANASAVVLEGLVVQANAGDGTVKGLIEIETSTGLTFRQCAFRNAQTTGIFARGSALTVEDCTFDGGDAAIHSQNGRGLMIRGNRIGNCANAGIRIWRDDNGMDSSIVTGNRIDKVDWRGGGNGQNGNGISIYKADDVIVSDNVISNCAFSAVRVNAGNNTQIRGNTCLASGEVAIFSEFGFSGSVVADNIIDGAATGISITNLDSGGHLATCTGNIVRNIASRSATNPDTQPVGIGAEADTVVADNTIENVPGIGIAAGTGAYVRNVVVSDNVVTGAQTGIAVSVVQQQSPGPVRVSGNIISGAQQAIVGVEWQNVVSDDLARDARRYPNVTVAENTVAE